MFANKTSHFVGSWYQPPGRNLVDLKSEIELLISQLQKIKSMHKGNTPPAAPTPSVHVLGGGASTSEKLFGQIDLTNQFTIEPI